MAILEVEKRNAITWVWLNRPERLNALDEELLDNLHRTFVTISQDQSVRVVVLAGRGKAFSSGFDIRWMVERTSEMVRSDRARLREIFDCIENCPQPIISVVQGDAMGGGLILTLVSDFVLASEQARFGVPEVKIGLFPSLKLIPRLERLVGIRAAKQMALIGNPIAARTAQDIGLITALSDSAETLYDEAQQLAEQLASLPTMALQVTKESFNAHLLPDYLEWETDHSVECWSEPERLSAMRSFLDKKKPPRTS